MTEEKEILQEKQETKPNRLRPKMTLVILVLAALFVMELYLMINDPKNYLLLGIMGLAILCSVYLVTDFAFKLQDEAEPYPTEDLERIYKAEKVSYVTMKKNFLEVGRLLDRVREISEVPTEELIQAQKAVGRVTIQRNKENAIAVISSNEKLISHIDDINGKLDEILQAVQSQHDNAQMLESLNHAAEQLDRLEATEQTLKDEFSGLTGSVAAQIDAAMHKLSEKPAEEAGSPETSAPEMESAPAELPTEETETLSESSFSTERTDFSEASLPAEGLELSEPSSSVETSDLAESSFPAESPEASETSSTAEAQALPETPSAAETQALPETPSPTEDPELSDISSSVEEPEPPETQEEPDAAAASSKAEPIEIKQTMSPEEIAALLEAQSEPEPPQELPEAPDASDPGHVMTPEEIAALLSNI